MSRHKKTLESILLGASDANINFAHICSLLIQLGFNERIKGDHHIFSKEGIPEIINLQPLGSLSKPYQVKQVRSLIVKHGLAKDIE